MAKSRISVDTTVPADQFVRSLTDFGKDRSEVWGNSEPGYLTVHEQGPDWAEVTEGSDIGGGIWQRYRYDWSTPGQVRLEVLDSNTFGAGSWWEYRLSPAPDGRTRIELTVNRVPLTVKARLLDVLLRFYGPIFYRRDLRRSLDRLARSQSGEGVA